MTNRDWMESLSNKELSRFLTCGLPLRCRYSPEGINVGVLNISLNTIAYRYIQSFSGIELWLASPQEFELAEEVYFE